MAKFYVLTKEQMESGHRPKTLLDQAKEENAKLLLFKEKHAKIKKINLLIATAIVLEHVLLLYFWLK